MNPREIIANMLHDFATGFWEGATMPHEMVAEFQSVRPNRVTITREGEILVSNRPMTYRRLDDFVWWLSLEYPWVLDANEGWTLPAMEERRVA